MPKNIITVGIQIPGYYKSYVSFKSNQSLLDADIAIIMPNIRSFSGVLDTTYLGKRCLGDDVSFDLKEHLEHWRREISEAVAGGKTVFIILDNVEEVYIATGSISYSGTGRNRAETRNVELVSNYRIVPSDLSFTSAKGREMVLSPTNPLLSDYWHEFGSLSEYRVLIQGKTLKPLVVTRSGNKVVGGLVSYGNKGGTLILLPHVDFDSDEFYDLEGEEEVWTKSAIASGNKFTSLLAGVSSASRSQGQQTPPPNWLSSPVFQLPGEKVIADKLVKLHSQRTKLDSSIQKEEASLRNERIVKGILFEKGPALETALVRAFETLGFEVTQYRDSATDIDIICESDEGRFIGEIEGKDTKPVNVDKLRQLGMNVTEDFAREEVSDLAKPVLIGNAHRLVAPDERGQCFTEKCIISARQSSTALLRTTDLFRAVQYLLGKRDKAFAKACRVAILDSIGVVEFPTQASQKRKPSASKE